jgi:hypothetical protein
MVIKMVTIALTIGSIKTAVNENQKQVQKKQSNGFLNTCKGILKSAFILIGMLSTSNQSIAMAIMQSDNSNGVIISFF